MNTFLLFSGSLLLLLMPCQHALAVDLDALEATVSAQVGKGEDCDDALAQRIGHDLPTDADSCHASEQYRLIKQGLYRTATGKIQSLNHKFKSLASQQSIDVPDIHQKQVKDKVSPYVIDLQGNLKAAKVENPTVHGDTKR